MFVLHEPTESPFLPLYITGKPTNPFHSVATRGVQPGDPAVLGRRGPALAVPGRARRTTAQAQEGHGYIGAFCVSTTR